MRKSMKEDRICERTVFFSFQWKTCEEIARGEVLASSWDGLYICHNTGSSLLQKTRDSLCLWTVERFGGFSDRVIEGRTSVSYLGLNINGWMKWLTINNWCQQESWKYWSVLQVSDITLHSVHSTTLSQWILIIWGQEQNRVPTAYWNLSMYLKCTGILKVYWNVLELKKCTGIVQKFRFEH